ncbi:uncharacterized protein BX663DRAFT_497978 [Cokeromyces recurvatus]|uniref:uncharacterized protein n=1 Tax=Cokeromyces recurvatus TaxID=90255 RepID=UPI00221F6413|nr:uncharacterized protein BX663DRAFT_497978 [Cokeromyces recurvatus]KAI7905879.1 hypothetical protein BX663DRAFT_497978 [Cokeromyces recurvatus]
MQRVIKACTTRIPLNVLKKDLMQKVQPKQMMPYLSICHHHYYSTAATKTMQTVGSTDMDKSSAEFHSHTLLDDSKEYKNFGREDFLKFRSFLWRERSWGSKEHILQVLDDMKRLGHDWTIAEYNDYFMVKLIKAEYNDILNMYREELQKRQPPMKLTTGTFNVLLATYIMLGMEKEAIELIRNVYKQHDVIPDIRDFARTMYRCMPNNTTIVEAAKHLIFDHAFDDNTEALNANIMHLFRERSFSDIKMIYEHCRSGSENQKKLDVTTYNALIKGYIDARLIRDAIETYKDMRKENIKPNVYICSSMLSIYAHRRDVASAEAIVRDTILGGHPPDENLYNQLIKVYFKARQTSKAVQIFEEIEKNPQLKVNEVIMNTMLDGLIINKEMYIAGLLYRQMMASDYKPDLITLNTMLKGYIETDDTPSAMGIISDMFKLGFKPDVVTFTTLVDSVFHKRAPTTAGEMMRIITEQLDITPNVYTFNAIINSWVQSGNMEQAEKTFELMKLPKYKHIEPTVHTYTNLIQGYIKQSDLNKAMMTFQTILRSGIRPDRATFNFMITGFLDHDRLADAYTCLEHMISMNISPTKDTWKLLLDDCCHKKDWVMGQKVVEALKQSGFLITSYSVRRPYTIIKKHCK